jgi:hypothetical protein
MLIPARGSVDASSDPVVARTKRRASRGFEDDAQRPRHITSQVQSIFFGLPFVPASASVREILARWTSFVAADVFWNFGQLNQHSNLPVPFPASVFLYPRSFSL